MPQTKLSCQFVSGFRVFKIEGIQKSSALFCSRLLMRCYLEQGIQAIAVNASNTVLASDENAERQGEVTNEVYDVPREMTRIIVGPKQLLEELRNNPSQEESCKRNIRGCLAYS